MEQALQGLLHSPQNNFRVFKNGNLIYGEDKGDLKTLFECLSQDVGSTFGRTELSKLIIQSLTRSRGPWDDRIPKDDKLTEIMAEHVKAPSRFDDTELADRVSNILSKKTDLRECKWDEPQCLPAYNALGLILERQMRHRCGADVVSWIWNNLSVVLNDGMTLQDLSPERIAAECEIADATDPDYRRKQILYRWIKQGKLTDDIHTKEEQNACDKTIDENLMKNFTIEDCCLILKNYLIFSTARDCSILIAFQEITHDFILERGDDQKVSAHRINKQYFLSDIGLVDLDMKTLKCIKKHINRDKQILETIISRIH